MNRMAVRERNAFATIEVVDASAPYWWAILR